MLDSYIEPVCQPRQAPRRLLYDGRKFALNPPYEVNLDLPLVGYIYLAGLT